MNRITRKKVLISLTGCLVVAAGVAIARASGTTTYDSVQYTHGGPQTTLQVTKVWDALDPLNITLEVHSEVLGMGLFQSLDFQVADDDDNNGTLDPSEWHTKKSGTISQGVGRECAWTPPFSVSLSHAGYRVVEQRSDIGMVVNSYQ